MQKISGRGLILIVKKRGGGGEGLKSCFVVVSTFRPTFYKEGKFSVVARQWWYCMLSVPSKNCTVAFNSLPQLPTVARSLNFYYLFFSSEAFFPIKKIRNCYDDNREQKKNIQKEKKLLPLKTKPQCTVGLRYEFFIYLSNWLINFILLIAVYLS